MLFKYQLRNEKGKIRKGKIEARDLEAARNKLALEEEMLLSLKPIQKNKKGHFLVFGRIGLLDKVMISKHLSVMIKAGMGIDMSLETIIGHTKSHVAKKLNNILIDVRQGLTLSDAFKKYPRDFDNLFISMVAVGESGGTLAKNLDILSKQQRKTYELRNKLKSSSIYPILILTAISVLGIIVSYFVLPKIVKFFTQLRIELPVSTKILLALADFMTNNWYWIIFAITLFIITIRVMLRFAQSRLILHIIILKIPIVSKISRDINLVLFTRTLASLLESGLSIDKALQITSKTVTNDLYKKELTTLYHSILKGRSLADSLHDEKRFPFLVVEMIRVGERSGNLSEVLDYLADFYEEEMDNVTKNLSTILEPALLVIIGLGVGFVALSIINPIYELTSKVGR